MYIRRTQTRSRDAGEPYFTHRLVRSERVGGRVKQVTLLNLGRHFELPTEQWSLFCIRLGELLSPQSLLVARVELPAVVEGLALRYAAQLQPRGRIDAAQLDTPVALLELVQSAASKPAEAPVLASDLVHADTLELLDPRSVGVEALALHALNALGIVQALQDAGLNRVSLAAALGQVVARMAHPASERASHAWLQQRSGLGELIGYDYGRMSLTRLYQVADSLWRHHDRMETALYQRLSEMFGLHDTIALYDLTNTYFEGLAQGNPAAKRGHSKEKRRDAPLLTLGLVLDGQGFVRRSQVFAGNVNEKASLAPMLDGLKAPSGALVILDRGIVSEANLSWLRAHGYRYLVMGRERQALQSAQTLTSASGAPIHWQRLDEGEEGEVRLLVHSPERARKETAMTTLQRSRFEAKLHALAASLSLPRRSKKAAYVSQRLGRLKAKHPSVARHYQITVDFSADGKLATALRYLYSPTEHSKSALPGHYVLRCNDRQLDGETLWRTYIQLTDLEAVFRSLKSELGLRPIYHHLDSRCQAHLWISVLAYQCVQYLRRKLKAQGMDASWTSIRAALAGQQRVTASFAAQHGGTLHVRKATAANAQAVAIYQALGLDSKPGGIKKRHFHPERDL